VKFLGRDEIATEGGSRRLHSESSIQEYKKKREGGGKKIMQSLIKSLLQEEICRTVREAAFLTVKESDHSDLFHQGKGSTR